MNKKINVGFLAHVDAGKTTITENLLFLSGATRKLGKVEDGNTTSDYLEIEKRRGISVKASSVALKYGDAEINIIDTPGHAEFISEVERSLSALDLAVIIVSAVEGIQPQTKVVFDAAVKMNIPTVFFINKVDRFGADPVRIFDALKVLSEKKGKGCVMINVPDGSGEVLENTLLPDDAASEIAAFDESVFESYVSGETDANGILSALSYYEAEGKIIPVLTGSGKMKYGMEELLSFISSFPLPEKRSENLSGIIFKLDHDKTLGAIAHVRLFGGSVKSRENVFIPRLNKYVKTTQLKKIQGGKLTDLSCAEAGDLFALCGIDEVRAGDFIGEEIPERKISLVSPHFIVKVECAPEKKPDLLKAISALDSEDPSLNCEWVPEKRVLTVRTTGKIHLEALKELIAEKYSIDAEFSKPSVIYKETPSKEGFGYEHYTMPKPCWAVVHLFIQPLERGSGIVFESITSDKDVHYKYQEHVKTSILDTCVKQGLHGWEVVDAKITLVGGEDHPEHTHPLDFFVATPMAFMDGLRNTGTTLLEPYIKAVFSIESNRANNVIQIIRDKRGIVESTETDGKTTNISAVIPEGETFTLKDEILSATNGKGIYTSEFSHYAPVPEGTGEDRERDGINPLDRAKWILFARHALQN